jgi:hypothetical protein
MLIGRSQMVCREYLPSGSDVEESNGCKRNRTDGEVFHSEGFIFGVRGIPLELDRSIRQSHTIRDPGTGLDSSLAFFVTADERLGTRAVAKQGTITIICGTFVEPTVPGSVQSKTTGFQFGAVLPALAILATFLRFVLANRYSAIWPNQSYNSILAAFLLICHASAIGARFWFLRFVTGLDIFLAF